jgi:Skp family chaperone for outer membrane proteins
MTEYLDMPFSVFSDFLTDEVEAVNRGRTKPELKAVITFGGNIDSSWNRSANGLQKSLKDVGKQSEKLTKDQAKLAAEIKRAKLAGQSLGDLKRRYSDVSREIRKTEAEQQKLNQQMQKAQRLAAFKGPVKVCFAEGWVSPVSWALWWRRAGDRRRRGGGLRPGHPDCPGGHQRGDGPACRRGEKLWRGHSDV